MVVQVQASRLELQVNPGSLRLRCDDEPAAVGEVVDAMLPGKTS